MSVPTTSDVREAYIGLRQGNALTSIVSGEVDLQEVANAADADFQQWLADYTVNMMNELADYFERMHERRGGETYPEDIRKFARGASKAMRRDITGEWMND